jgi:hypothetical protein
LCASPTCVSSRLTRGAMSAAPRVRHLQREGDVVLGRAVAEQPEVLEDHADPPAELRNVAAPDEARREAADAHLARGRELRHLQQAQHGRLPRAGVAGEERQLSLLHQQIDVTESRPRAGVLLVDRGQLDHARQNRGGRWYKPGWMKNLLPPGAGVKDVRRTTCEVRRARRTRDPRVRRGVRGARRGGGPASSTTGRRGRGRRCRARCRGPATCGGTAGPASRSPRGRTRPS